MKPTLGRPRRAGFSTAAAALMVYCLPMTLGHAMQLVSVNVGSRRTQPKGDELETTGIYKLPVLQPVELAPLGIPGDFIADLDNHGGPDQAIYVYGTPDYDWWSKVLNWKLPPGTFGDNLTISDLESARFSIGDRLRVGSALVEGIGATHPVLDACPSDGRSDVCEAIPPRGAARFVLSCPAARYPEGRRCRPTRTLHGRPGRHPGGVPRAPPHTQRRSGSPSLSQCADRCT